MKKLLLLFIGCLIVQGSMQAMHGTTTVTYLDTLAKAISDKDLQAVEDLLQSGRFNVNEPLQGSGKTYLHEAAEWGTPAIVATLLAAGADVNRKNGRGETPLHCAARWGRDKNALVLIVAGGANVDQQDEEFGWTALHWAIAAGKFSFIKVLVNGHANIDIPDKGGRTPVEMLALVTGEGCLDPADLKKKHYHQF